GRRQRPPARAFLSLGLRPAPGGMTVRRPMSRRAVRWFSSESNPQSATAVKRRLGTRRQAGYSSGSSQRWSAPAPVDTRAARIAWQAQATAKPALGSFLVERRRVREPPASAISRASAFASEDLAPDRKSVV